MKILCRKYDHGERSGAHRERSDRSKTKIIANHFKFQLEIQKVSSKMLQRIQIHSAARMIWQMQDRVVVKNDSIDHGNPKQSIVW